MDRSVSKGLAVVATIAVAIVLLSTWLPGWFASSDRPPSGTITVVSSTVETPATAPTTSPPPPAMPVPDASRETDRSQPIPEQSIHSALQDPGAVLRNIVARSDTDQVVCGEKRGSKDANFKRFVFLPRMNMIATDDGTADFDRTAALCQNGAPGP